jgi:hypothetical protein
VSLSNSFKSVAPEINPRLLASILAEDRPASLDDNDDATGKMFEVAGHARTKHSRSWKVEVTMGFRSPFVNWPRQSNLLGHYAMDTSSRAVLGLEKKRNECIRNLCVAGSVEGRKPRQGTFAWGSNDKR